MYEDKKFRAYPIKGWYEMLKQISNVDTRTQKELENFSNDPQYAEKLHKMKGKSKVNQMIEDYSSKARQETGIEENEQNQKMSTLKNMYMRKKENLNKEDADFDECEELFQEDDENDVIHTGLDFIPDEDEDIDKPNNPTETKNIVKRINKAEEDLSESEQSASFYDSESSEGPEEEDDNDSGKPSTFKIKAQQSQSKSSKAREEYKFEQDDESDDEFAMKDNHYAPPTMQKGPSESSDFFADSPAAKTSGMKRMHSDEDVFNSDSYKRFKS